MRTHKFSLVIIFAMTIVIIAGIAALFLIEDKLQPATFHSVAEEWCLSKDGKFDNGARIGGSFTPECTVPVYKGAAGISTGLRKYELTYTVKDYDTGYSEVYAQREIPIREYIQRIHDSDTPSEPPFQVGSFIKKGKYN